MISAFLALIGAQAGCGGGAPDPVLEIDRAAEGSMALIEVGAWISDEETSGPAAAAEAAALDTNSASFLIRWSEESFSAGRHGEALARLSPFRSAWEAALGGRDPGWSAKEAAALLTGLAMHLAAAGEAEAAAACRTILAADTTDKGLAASRLAYLELKGDDFSKAADPAARAFRADSSHAVRLNNYAITRLQAGDVASAERLFRKAIERKPRLPGPYYNLAILEAFYRMNTEAGRRWFASYKRLSDADPDRLAEAFEAQGKPAGSRPEGGE